MNWLCYTVVTKGYHIRKEVLLKALLITFEGQEGAGKSTQINLLYNYLLQKGADVILTREPGGTNISEKIRRLLKDNANTDIAKKTESLLYMAARAQLVQEIISPHLAKGGIVLADRYIDSTIAYQGFASGLDISSLEQINAFATNNLVPDITFLLRIEARAGLARNLADAPPDRIEQKDIAYHINVSRGYEHILKKHQDRIIVIDANLEKDHIHKEIIKHIKNRGIT